MYPDHSLMPKEAVRLAALAHVAEREMSYRDLATAVRNFVGRIMGPSLDLMGASIELLRYEGLIAAVGGSVGTDAGAADDSRLLQLTEAGRRELRTLLTASVRAPFNDLNRLVVALKMRFLALLSPDERRAQADMLTAASETELARLKDLAAEDHPGEASFTAWLAQEIALVETRLSWLRDFRAGL
jgi:DNA-binding PadR family transcriptional regulator